MSLQNVTSYKQYATFPFTHFVLHVFEVSRLCRNDCNPTMAQRCVTKNDNHANIHVPIHTPMVTTFDTNMEIQVFATRSSPPFHQANQYEHVLHLVVNHYQFSLML